MSISLTGRSFLTLKDFSADEIRTFLSRAHEVKQEPRNGKPRSRFAGKNLALLFEKRSTRTRCAFETAFGEEGGNSVFLSTADIHLGAKETLEDTARVFGRMFDGIQYRGFGQQIAETFAKYSGVPVYNGLTNSYHPTQVLADFMTIEDRLGILRGLNLCYVGDGRNNVAVSLAIGCAKLGINLTIASPQELRPSRGLLDDVEQSAAKTDAKIRYTSDVGDGVNGANVLYTDVWTSMGEESEVEHRKEILTKYQVNAGLMEQTGKPDTIFLHCLPAVRGQEVTANVIDGPQSAVWDQAENRKHSIKALMLETMF